MFLWIRLRGAPITILTLKWTIIFTPFPLPYQSGRIFPPPIEVGFLIHFLCQQDYSDCRTLSLSISLSLFLWHCFSLRNNESRVPQWNEMDFKVAGAWAAEALKCGYPSRVHCSAAGVALHMDNLVLHLCKISNNDIASRAAAAITAASDPSAPSDVIAEHHSSHGHIHYV